MMKNQFFSLRFQFIRSHLKGVLLTTIMLTIIMYSLNYMTDVMWLTLNQIFLIIGIYVFVGTILAIIIGFHSSSFHIKRLHEMSALISQFANGNYHYRIDVHHKDELTRVTDELNRLGMIMQKHVRSLQRMAEENEAFSKEAHKTAVIEERQRLARDLHDAVSQQLFAITMMSEAIIKQIDQHPELAKEQLQDVVEAAYHSQAEMRALLLHLRPVYLSGKTLADGVESLIKELEAKSNLTFEVKISQGLELPEIIEEHVFRMIQEGFSNILRHANATVIKLSIIQQSNELNVKLQDNGDGFEIDEHFNKSSLGLKTMRERSEELGGICTIRSNVNEGTMITIRIPL